MLHNFMELFIAKDNKNVCFYKFASKNFYSLGSTVWDTFETLLSFPAQKRLTENRSVSLVPRCFVKEPDAGRVHRMTARGRMENDRNTATWNI